MAERAVKYAIHAADLARLTGRSEADVLASTGGRSIGPPARNRGLEPADARAVLAHEGYGFPFRVVAHINLRGGIGKTTASITLATRAAQYGFRTCLLDLDPQGSASLAFDRIPDPDAPIFCDVWSDPVATLPGALALVQDGLSLLPSGLENALLDGSLGRPAAQKRAVAGVCERLRALGFDLVVVDCPPALGTAVISTICAADTIVVPAGSDPFSVKGVELTVQEARAIRATFGLPEPSIRILYTHYDRRERMAHETIEVLRARYDGAVLPSVIRTSTEFAKALGRRETVFASHRPSRARDDYDAYARCLLGLDAAFGRSA